MILNYVISPPFAFQVGDTFVLDGHLYQQWRAGHKISERDLRLMVTAPLTSPYHGGGNSITNVFLEGKPMPGQNVSCTKVQENQNTGAVTFSFSSGNNTEYPDWDAVGAVADSIDADPAYAEKLLAMKAFRASPDGANKTTQVGASVSVNGLADVPVVYTEPQP